jgi:hypothetical protein
MPQKAGGRKSPVTNSCRVEFELAQLCSKEVSRGSRHLFWICYASPVAKRTWIGAALVAVIAAGLILFWPRRSLVFPVGAQQYQVISAQCAPGGNFVLASDYPFLQWSRRMLDKAGVHLKGSRLDGRTLTGDDYAVALLCRGDKPGPANFSSLTNEILECVGKDGKALVAGKHWAWRPGPPGRIWLIWYFNHDEASPDTGSGEINKQNFKPREFRVLRRADRETVLSIAVSAE